MTTPSAGWHPLQRVVHRLATISPHRQVEMLFAISMLIVVVMVVAVLGSLSPTRASLGKSDDRLVPAIEQLDVARTRYNAASSALLLAISSDPNTRATGVSDLTAANSGGENAFRAFRKLSMHLPGEADLQRSFVLNRRVALVAGQLLLTQPLPSAAALSAVTQASSALQLNLDRLKELYETKVQRSLSEANREIDATERQIMLVSGGALLMLVLAFGVAARSARSREQRLDALDRALHEDAERNELEARLQRSLEMAHTEDDTYTVVQRAMAISAPSLPAELLVADSSRAHFRQVAKTEGMSVGCPVLTPVRCPAATWGQTQIWPSSTALDACPELRGRPDGDCSAVCVPVSVGGNTIGVVHSTGPDRRPPTEAVVSRVELIARKFGERVGMLRAFQRSESQAHTDPLTGLMNRRSLEEKVRMLTDDGVTYVAAYGDLDHFKVLNDLHGHDAGDQALRLFARVMRDAVRPGDLTARYGGEEFVVVLPDCMVSDAYAVINRLREALAAAQTGARTAPFTVSFGITPARPENTFSETLEIADAALLKAKATGRDRIVISDAAADDEDSERGAPRPT